MSCLWSETHLGGGSRGQASRWLGLPPPTPDVGGTGGAGCPSTQGKAPLRADRLRNSLTCCELTETVCLRQWEWRGPVETLVAVYWHSTYHQGNGKWLSCFLAGLKNYLALSAHLRVDFSKQVLSLSHSSLFGCQSIQSPKDVQTAMKWASLLVVFRPFLQSPFFLIWTPWWHREERLGRKRGIF